VIYKQWLKTENHNSKYVNAIKAIKCASLHFGGILKKNSIWGF